MRILHKFKFITAGTAVVILASFPAYSQGHGGTGMPLKTLEQLCQAGAMIAAMGNVSTNHYINTTLKGRYSMGNSTLAAVSSSSPVVPL